MSVWLDEKNLSVCVYTRARPSSQHVSTALPDRNPTEPNLSIAAVKHVCSVWTLRHGATQTEGHTHWASLIPI